MLSTLMKRRILLYYNLVLMLSSLYRQFPAMAPKENTTEFAQLQEILGHDLHPGYGRTPNVQGAYQIATLAITLAVAIAGGIVTGV